MYHQKISSIIVAISTVSILTLLNTSARAVTLQYSSQFGTYGNANGQFEDPSGVAVDNSGNLYVADSGNNRIDEFTSTGTFITSFGSQGGGNGQFNIPRSVAVDSSGNVYVYDTGNNRIDEFNPSNFLNTFTSFGTNIINANTNGGTGAIAISTSNNNIYVTETGNERIDEFTSTGTFITSFGSQGSGNGQFSSLGGIAIDNSGNLYVADYENSRIQEFTSTGTFITSFGSFGKFFNPNSVAVDKNGNVYVADPSAGIESFNPNNFNGTYTDFTGLNEPFSPQYGPGSIALDNSGKVYLADYGNQRVEVLSSTTPSQVPIEIPGGATIPALGSVLVLGILRSVK